MTKTFAFLTAAALTLAACSQNEPEMVDVQPTFDKAGNASCVAGYELATTADGATVCAPVAQ